MAARQHDERSRKIVHMAVGGGALALRYLLWWQAAIAAAAALAFNLFVLPRVAGQLYRHGERPQSTRSGIVLYPASVLLLILVFHERLDIAATAWAILAAGDGMATLVGRRIGRGGLPWNSEKSVAGTVAFFCSASVAGIFVAWWCRPNVAPQPDLWFSIAAPLVAALVAALVETIPIELDDNISVPVSAAAVLWALSLVRTELVWPAVLTGGQSIVLASAANVVVAWLGCRAGMVTTAGAVTGALIGVVITVTTGWAGWTLLLATFLAASGSSRLGLRRKTMHGIAEDRGGRRGPENAIANTGLATVAALLAVSTVHRDLALLAFVTALAAGGSDTMASEIGKAWGRRTYLVTTFRRVPPGTSGAMSLAGTLAGVAGAALLGGIAAAVGLIAPTALVAVVAGATVGSLAESLLGATLEAPGILNNDMLNFLNTAIAAGAAMVVAGLVA
jgi:uncharacterized protein (TIGR00297 family)